MFASTARLRRPFALLLVVTVLGALAACGRGEDQPSFNLEGVSTPGDNPFTPSVGTDQPGVTPPQGAGGTFPGDTVGLFGGTRNSNSCDKAKMLAFLQQDQAKAAGWATVLGIRVEDIQPFVAGLTPAILRSDTRVTNHGFKDGHVIEIPAVLQAGTAVLVDNHGQPVTKCFCGNPLTPPPAFTTERFHGQQWQNFSSTQVTVIAPVTQTVQQFVFVQPGTNNSFQRPAGTTGQQDMPAPSPAPTVFPPPASPLPSVPQTGHTTTSGGLPPGLAAPSPSASASPAVPTVSPPPIAPTGTVSAPSPTRPPSPSPTVTPSPTMTPAPTATPPPTTAAPVPPPGSPSVTPTAPPTVTPSGAPSASPTLTPVTPLRASWVVGDCFVRSGQAHGLVLVRPDAAGTHTFTVQVRLGAPANPVAVETVRVAAATGQIGQAEVKAPTSSPDGRLQCAILSIVDETGATPVAGEPLPPPPDSNPMPAQPGGGAPSGPSVPATPPPPIVPGGSPT